ncbi:MAG TPA: flagellar biosynthetic protein FliQ [Paracoccus sp.]|nr:flagellar biosynthetic protein FliQ [Paracoccus sp. (in: a-proteobacteria)]
MDENLIFDVTRQALWVAVRMAAPLLAVALITGVAIGLFQALTSVQEMTLTFVPKVGLMLVVFWVTMSFMTSTLAGFFSDGILPLIARG